MSRRIEGMVHAAAEAARRTPQFQRTDLERSLIAASDWLNEDDARRDEEMHQRLRRREPAQWSPHPRGLEPAAPVYGVEANRSAFSGVPQEPLNTVEGIGGDEIPIRGKRQPQGDAGSDQEHGDASGVNDLESERDATGPAQDLVQDRQVGVVHRKLGASGIVQRAHDSSPSVDHQVPTAPGGDPTVGESTSARVPNSTPAAAGGQGAGRGSSPDTPAGARGDEGVSA